MLFTIAYLTSLIMTLVSALQVIWHHNYGKIKLNDHFFLQLQATLLTIICTSFQFISLIWYIVSYFPGGQTGLIYISKGLGSVAYSSLPV